MAQDSEDDEIFPLSFGESFNNRFFAHSLRYDFKPNSIDSKKDAKFVVQDSSVELSHADGSRETCYVGSKRPAKKECVLIIDDSTGTARIELLSESVTVAINSKNEKPEKDKGEGVKRSKSRNMGVPAGNRADGEGRCVKKEGLALGMPPGESSAKAAMSRLNKMQKASRKKAGEAKSEPKTPEVTPTDSSHGFNSDLSSMPVLASGPSEQPKRSADEKKALLAAAGRQSTRTPVHDEVVPDKKPKRNAAASLARGALERKSRLDQLVEQEAETSTTSKFSSPPIGSPSNLPKPLSAGGAPALEMEHPQPDASQSQGHSPLAANIGNSSNSDDDSSSDSSSDNDDEMVPVEDVASTGDLTHARLSDDLQLSESDSE